MSASAPIFHSRLCRGVPHRRLEGGNVRLGMLMIVLLAIGSVHVQSAALTPYPLTTCIVTGDKLDDNAIVFAYDGREIKTCCTNCIDEFYKDPAGFSARIDEETARAEKK
jgi:hypothetical protein